MAEESDTHRSHSLSLSRRAFATGAATLLIGAGAGTVFGRSLPLEDAQAAPTSDAAGSGGPDPLPSIDVGPADPRYTTLATGFNQRFVGKPASIAVVSTPDQLLDAVRQALRDGRRITVRGGGHCYEGFVSDNTDGVIIDISGMRGVSAGADGSVTVQAGCTNWDVYERIYKNFNVTIPAGSCYSVGLGGHIVGGGYGLLSREFGLSVDYLQSVDVITVNAERVAELVTARRGDPDTGELFWAHTGGGGGTFGVIVAYTFANLPEPPQQVQLATTTWQWAALDHDSFATIVRNYGTYLEANSSPDSAARVLFSLLKLKHRAADTITLTTQVSGIDTAILDDFLSRMDADIPAAARPTTNRRIMPWLQATQTLNGSGPNQRGKYKSAYMRTAFPAAQIDAMYAALTDSGYANAQALLQVDSYGCRINAVASDATAVSQRSSIMKLQYQTYWENAADDEKNLDWIRRFYQSVYADNGGEPVSNGITDGCYVNYPDVDLVDWPRLYFKGNYPRLQQVKAAWDPTDQFRNAQSVRLP